MNEKDKHIITIALQVAITCYQEEERRMWRADELDNSDVFKRVAEQFARQAKEAQELLDRIANDRF
jgi:hypothetical protein